MKQTLNILFLIITTALICGCTSIYEQSIDKRTTETFYDSAGKVARVVVVEDGVKKLEKITNTKAAADALKVDSSKLSERSVALSNFNLGEGGLKWFSLDVQSVQAPAKQASSDSVLQSVATSKQAGKTQIQTSTISVNASTKSDTEKK